MAGTAARVCQSLFTTHTARSVVVAFAAVTLGGTALLSLPVASQEGGATGFVTGPVTLVSALTLRERARRCRLPEERPVIG